MRRLATAAAGLAVGASLAIPAAARADNCSGLSDCSSAVKIALLLLALLALAAMLYVFLGPLLSSALARAAASRIAARAAFAGEQTFLRHFQKHAAEFGYTTAQQYLAGARALIAESWSPTVQTFVRSNGDRLFYRAATNEFAVLTRDGVIRTYFKPAQGLAYWLRQIAP